MTRHRLLLLTAGPAALSGVFYLLCLPATGREQVQSLPGTVAASRSLTPAVSPVETDLERACRLTLTDLQTRLHVGMSSIVRPPFILLGECPPPELEQLYSETVLPVTRCLWRSYFDRRPNAPVTVIVLRDEPSYAAVAARLDGYESSSYSGYTQRGQRRIVVNLSSGRGTLVHELSHILALFDFPDMPEWFDEGLAALHEDAVLSDDGLRLIGVENWRSRFLREALSRDQLPTLESVLTNPVFRGQEEGLNYAQARALCLFLQDRGLLSHFYRKFRDGYASDRTGAGLLCALFDADSLAEVDRQFRDWLTHGEP
ncbi:MAG: hypothetical protein JSS02_00645 [Planctomycetes bacterium]|nr:hypothetical protein [Planctomycetota bacterium]